MPYTDTGKSTSPPPSLHTHPHTYADVHTSHFLLSLPSLQPSQLVSSPPLAHSSPCEQDRMGVLSDYQLLPSDYTPGSDSERKIHGGRGRRREETQSKMVRWEGGLCARQGVGDHGCLGLCVYVWFRGETGEYYLVRNGNQTNTHNQLLRLSFTHTHIRTQPVALSHPISTSPSSRCYRNRHAR